MEIIIMADNELLDAGVGGGGGAVALVGHRGGGGAARHGYSRIAP